MPFSPEVQEVRDIASRLGLSIDFISGMLAGSPSRTTVFRFIQGEPIRFNHAASIVYLCRALKKEADASPRPMAFYDVPLWRKLLLKAGYSVHYRKGEYEAERARIKAQLPSTVLKSAAPSRSPNPSDSCHVTKPPLMAFNPPSPYPAELPASSFWFGTENLWTMLPMDGTWKGLPHSLPTPDSASGNKLFWWHEGYDWRTEKCAESGGDRQTPGRARSTA